MDIGERGGSAYALGLNKIVHAMHDASGNNHLRPGSGWVNVIVVDVALSNNVWCRA